MRDSENQQSEQRARRVPVNLKVAVVGDAEDGDELQQAMLVNVARGGVFVGTDTPAEVGSLIHLQFRMLKARICQAVGTVVWKRGITDQAEQTAAGFGVAFVDTNKNMDAFVRNVSALPEKLRGIYLADVLDPRIELGVSTCEVPAVEQANEVA